MDSKRIKEAKAIILETIRNDPRSRAAIWSLVRQMADWPGLEGLKLSVVEQWKRDDKGFGADFAAAIQEGRTTRGSGKRVGRPLALTEDKQKRIVELVAHGATIEAACVASGVSLTTYERFRKRVGGSSDFLADVAEAIERRKEWRRAALLGSLEGGSDD